MIISNLNAGIPQFSSCSSDDVEEFKGGGVGKIPHTSRLKDDNTNPNKESGKLGL